MPSKRWAAARDCTCRNWRLRRARTGGWWPDERGPRVRAGLFSQDLTRIRSDLLAPPAAVGMLLLGSAAALLAEA